MKKNNTLLAAKFILFVNFTYSQRPKDIKNSALKGIFLTYADFKQKKLICSSNNQNKDIKVAINQKFIGDEMLYSMNQKSRRFIINEFLTELTQNKQ